MTRAICILLVLMPTIVWSATIHVGKDHMIYRGADGKIRTVSIDHDKSYDGTSLRHTRAATIPMPAANVPITLQRVVPKNAITAAAALRMVSSPLVTLPLVLYDLVKDLPTIGPGLHQTPDGLMKTGYPPGTYNIPEPPMSYTSACETTYTYMQQNGIAMGIYVAPSGKACLVRRTCPNAEPEPDPTTWMIYSTQPYPIPPGPSQNRPETPCWVNNGYYAGAYKQYTRRSPMQPVPIPAQPQDVETYIQPRITSENADDIYDSVTPPHLAPETLISPTSIMSSPRTTTTQSPDGTVTKTETTRYDVTQDGDIITITTIIITNITYPDGTTATTEQTVPPEPPLTQDEIDQSDPEYDIPQSDTVARRTLELTYQPETLSWSASCPSDITITTPWGQRAITWWPICELATQIRPVVIVVATIASILILYGIRQTDD